MKNLFLSLLILLTSFSVKAQNSNLPYSEKDYLITMNEVVNTVQDLYNSNWADTAITTRLMDLSSDSVYVLSGGMDQRYPSNYSIKEWFIPTINGLYTFSQTTLEITEKDLCKWGVWFRVKVTDMYGVNYIDFAINRENKLRSIIL